MTATPPPRATNASSDSVISFEVRRQTRTSSSTRSVPRGRARLSRGPAIIDTNVVSFVFGHKREADLYREDLAGRRIFLAFQTVGEVLLGAKLAGWGKDRLAELSDFLRQYRPIYPDARTVKRWATMRSAMTKAGHVLSFEDSWIAACALSEDLPLIAHDSAFRLVPKLDLICRAPEKPREGSRRLRRD